jgi:hypothetical protein
MAKAYVPPISIKVPQDRKYAENWEKTFGRRSKGKESKVKPGVLRDLRAAFSIEEP